MNLAHEISFEFGMIEYGTFIFLLVLSVIVGIYYGCFKGNQNTVSEYMLGGRKMSVFPISMSLIAGHISGITLLGVPSEVYEYGIQYVSMCWSTLMIVYCTSEIFLPVLYNLKLNNIFEYLEMRFSKNVRKLASLNFALTVITSTPVVIYIPALAFKQVTNISVFYTAPVICFTCIFYTSIGGLKAVVWADAIQSIFTAGAMLAITVLGVMSVGGIENIFQISRKGERLEMFDMNPDPFARMTFWTVTLGSGVHWAHLLAFHPGSVQRFISLPTLKQARLAVLIFGIGMCVVKIATVFVGLIMYAKYHDCDPVTSKIVEKSGQLMPYYVLNVASGVPGLTGLFVSGLVSAALSTMSASLNTVSGTIYEDLMERHMPKTTSQTTASFIMKIIVVLFGIISIFLVYVVEKLGAILQMSISLWSITSGASCAAFIAGMLLPWVNKKGILTGMICSCLIMGWIIIGAQFAIAKHDLVFQGKPVSIQGCMHINVTTFKTDDPITGKNLREISAGVFAAEGVHKLYSLSYMYYTATGCLLAIFISIVASFFTGFSNLESVNPDLISPIMRGFLPAARADQPVKYSVVNQNPNQELKRIKHTPISS